MPILKTRSGASASVRPRQRGVRSAPKGRSKDTPRREPIIPPPFNDLSPLARRQLAKSRDAARELFDLLEECARTGHHPVRDLVGASSAAFTRWSVYPVGGVKDVASGYAWFYHAHDPSEARPWEEHGHFHCFALRHRVREGARALALPKDGASQGDLVHLAAISIDLSGVPTRLFAINRWATGEAMYEAGDVLPLVDQFEIRTDDRFQLTSRWLGVMLRIFHPTLPWLLGERDRVLGARRAADPSGFSEDKKLEVAAVAVVDVDAHLAALDRAWDKKGRRPAA